MKIDRDRIVAFLMLSPSLVLLAIFVYGFIGQTAWVSLTDWGNNPATALREVRELSFVGLDNYRNLFTGVLETRFRQDLVNNLFFTLFFLAGCLGLGLGMAILLDQKIRGENIFRTLFLYPFALAFVVTGTIWDWMLQPRGGINALPTLVGLPRFQFEWIASRKQILKFNWQDVPFWISVIVLVILAAVLLRALLKRNWSRSRNWGIATGLFAVWTFFGATRVNMLGYPETHGFNLALIGIVVAAVWQMSGYTMALYLAGLRGIPEQLREAARVDGATEVQVYRHVVFPLLAPITLSAMIILGHISLKIFDLVFVMGGPDNATTSVPALLMYVRSFRANRFAEGGAIAVVLLIMVAAVIIPYLWTQLRGEVRR